MAIRISIDMDHERLECQSRIFAHLWIKPVELPKSAIWRAPIWAFFMKIEPNLNIIHWEWS